MGDELNSILPKSARPLYFSFLIKLLGIAMNKYYRKKIVNDFTFQFATFSLQNITSLDASLDVKI